MKMFSKPFKGVPNGEIYPVNYKPGDAIPDELLAAAEELNAIGEGDGKTPTGDQSMTVAQIKVLLDEKGIAYDQAAKKADLLALLPPAAE